MKKLSPTISRREFLKQHLFFILYAYLSQFFTKEIDSYSNSQKNEYAILDKLLEIPFSEPVKKEVELRVKLQKRYAYDANGHLQPLDRFLEEIVYFIIYHKNENDFILLYNIRDTQIDYNYLLKTTIKLDDHKSLEKMKGKLLSMNDSLLNDLLFYAVKSRSIKSINYLLSLDFTLQKSTEETIIKTVSKKEYETFYKTLTQSMKTPLLPKNLNFQKSKNRYVKKRAIEEYCGTFDEYLENLYAIVYNSVCDLYLEGWVDEYSVYLEDNKCNINFSNYSGVYDMEFFSIFESILLTNGFNRYISEIDDIDFETAIGERALAQKQHSYLANIDYYNFINIEML